jgi:hypothetical protein
MTFDLSRNSGTRLMTGILSFPVLIALVIDTCQASSSFDATLAVGLHYDDKVTVEELDRFQDVGDSAVVIDLDLDYEHNFAQGTDLRLGYSLAQRSYFEESDFDLQIHNLSFGLKQDFDAFDLGVEAYHVHARLDNDELLSFQHVSPYFTTFLTRRLYLRGAYFYRDKEFPDNPGRDAHVHAADADLYFFMDSTRHYIVVGARYEDEDTRDAEFDFRGHQFDIRYSRRFDLYGDRPVRLRLDYRFEDRDYRSPTPSIGAVRDDQRQRWRVRLDLPIRRNLTALLSYQYRDHKSNLPGADFTDNRAEVQLEVVF